MGERAATDVCHEHASNESLLVVRVQGGAWCGTCRYSAAHTAELFALPRGDRIRVLDVVIGNRENAPAKIEDAIAWRALVNASAEARDRVTVTANPTLAVPNGTVLPLILLVDARTMHVLGASANPDPVELAREVDAAFATIDGVESRGERAEPSPRAHEDLVDGLFHRNEWEMIRDVTVPTPPTDVASASEIAFGKALFFDRGLSPANVACASCHDPSRGFGDSHARAHGAGEGERKTPRIALSSFSPKLFWDGRADTLEAQAKGPLENPMEMASSAAFVAHRIETAFASMRRAAFPDHSIDERDPASIVRAEDDATHAIASYERTLRVKANALDAYVAGDRNALTFLEKQGLAMFAREGCMQCHWGPRLTDDAFHVTRTPSGHADGSADVGRASIAVGAFKTPSLRGVAHAVSFGHGGVFRSIDEVVGSYGSGGIDASDSRAAGVREAWLPRFGETTRWSIDAFVSKLDD
jgi:cytochrome c peroxidase